MSAMAALVPGHDGYLGVSGGAPDGPEVIGEGGRAERHRGVDGAPDLVAETAEDAAVLVSQRYIGADSYALAILLVSPPGERPSRL